MNLGETIMANTNVNIRMDSDLKKQFENFCSDMGMTMTVAFTVFAKKVVREHRIPFEIGESVPNADTLAAVAEVENMRKNPSSVKAYDNVDEMLEDVLGEV